MTKLDLVTIEDLNQFKQEILQEIRELLSPAKPENRQWLRSVDVRKMLKISSGTLQNLRINGSLPYQKVGGILYYNQQDLLNIMGGGNG